MKWPNANCLKKEVHIYSTYWYHTTLNSVLQLQPFSNTPSILSERTQTSIHRNYLHASEMLTEIIIQKLAKHNA